MTKRTTPRRVKAVALYHWASGKSFFTIPYTRAAYDAAVKQMVTAWMKYHGFDFEPGPVHYEVVRAQLRSIGITRPPS